MSLRRWCTLGPLALVVTAATSCGDSNGPAGLTGTFQLVTVNGEPLPYVIPIGFGSRNIVSGAIVFRGRGRLLDVREYQSVGATGPQEPVADTLAQAYTLAGTRLLVSRSAAGGAQVYADTGTVEGSFITLEVRDVQELRNKNLEMVFQRQ
jgi:hypothetical protein